MYLRVLGTEDHPNVPPTAGRRHLFSSIALVRPLPCLAERGRIIVIGRPQHSLEPVIPGLATLPGVIAYNPERGRSTFRRERGFLSLQSKEVCITQGKDVAEGLDLLQALTESINAVR